MLNASPTEADPELLKRRRGRSKNRSLLGRKERVFSCNNISGKDEFSTLPEAYRLTGPPLSQYIEIQLCTKHISFSLN